jgi:hypothetical protein
VPSIPFYEVGIAPGAPAPPAGGVAGVAGVAGVGGVAPGDVGAAAGTGWAVQVKLCVGLPSGVPPEGREHWTT